MSCTEFPQLREALYATWAPLSDASSVSEKERPSGQWPYDNLLSVSRILLAIPVWLVPIYMDGTAFVEGVYVYSLVGAAVLFAV